MFFLTIFCYILLIAKEKQLFDGLKLHLLVSIDTIHLFSCHHVNMIQIII